jgi:very-short-patch-repair endonuclease
LNKEGRKTPAIPSMLFGEESTPPAKEGPHKGKIKSITFAKREVAPPAPMTVVFNKHKMKKRRQTLRNLAPRAEVVLWRYLKDKRLSGYKFRRQYSVGPYVIDFYCPKIKLAIEVDGPTHFNKEARIYDRVRQEYIEQFNIRFLRFMNSDVYNNIEGVIEKILEYLR